MIGQEKSVVIPMPTVRPLGIEVNTDMVQEVWNTFIKPDQDAGIPQSGETRTLMAILRSVNEGLRRQEVAE